MLLDVRQEVLILTIELMNVNLHAHRNECKEKFYLNIYKFRLL